MLLFDGKIHVVFILVLDVVETGSGDQLIRHEGSQDIVLRGNGEDEGGRTRKSSFFLDGNKGNLAFSLERRTPLLTITRTIEREKEGGCLNNDIHLPRRR